MKRSRLMPAYLAVLALAVLIVPVAAVTITESPDTVTKGGTVTLDISGLPDGASFSLLIGGKFGVTPGERFTFETRNFNMPFSLSQGTVSATTQGTKSTSFSVAKGDALVQVSNAADANGYFTISKDYEITSGVYDYLSLSGRARSDTSIITSSMNLLGTKKGPQDSRITFTIDGIDNGEVYLTALVNGDQVMYKKIIVGNGIDAVTTVATTEPAETEAPDETTTTTTVPGAVYVPTAATTSAAATTTAGASVPGAATFSSADRMVRLNTAGIDYAAILMVSEVNPPADWVMVGDAYKIAPENLVFSSPATLSFTVPASTANYAYFVAELENDRWVVVPSSAGSGTIDADIDSIGTYALMGYVPESSLPVATATVSGKATAKPEYTPSDTGVKTTPRVASIAKAGATTSVSAASTKASPLDPLPVIGALAICSVAVFIIRNRG